MIIRFALPLQNNLLVTMIFSLRDAPRLWKDTSSIDAVNEIVEAWLITLEKQGCHHLVTGGPAAVQQAIVLSLGGLRFSNQHLEFNIDPQYLHRDYLFRYHIHLSLSLI